MEQSSLKKVLKISGILLTGNMFASLLGIIIMSIITKNISIEQYGIIVMIQAYIMFVDQLFNFQSWQALIKYGSLSIESQSKNDLIKYIRLSFFLDVFGSILAFSFSLLLLTPLSDLFGFDVNLLNSYLFYSIIILFRMVGTPTALLRLTEQYKYFNYQLALNWLTKLVFILLLFVNNSLTVHNILIVFILGEIISSIYLVFYGIKALKQYNISVKEIILNQKEFFFQPKSKRFLIFALRTNINGAVLGSIRTIDELIIGALLGPASAAIFKIMKLIGSIVTKILDPLYVSSYPEISKLVAKNEHSQILNMIKQISIINFLISFTVTIAFYFLGDLIITLLFTQQYLTAVPIIQVYLIGVLLSFIFFYLQPLMLAFELEAKALIINSISAVSYILLLYILSKYYGLWAIAISFLIFNLLVTIPKFYYIQKKTRLFYSLRRHS